MKALPVRVFKNPLYKECSNDGITKKYDELLLVCDEGYIDIDETNLPENLVILVKKFVAGRPANYIRPYADVPDGCVGYMSGGAYAASSDGRFDRMVEMYGAVPVHDRVETYEQNDRLSR